MWYCIVCTKELFPYSKLNDENLILTLKGKKIKFINVAQKRIPGKTQFLQWLNLGVQKINKMLILQGIWIVMN